MLESNRLEKLWIAAGEKVKEREYWLERLSGELVKNGFPYDHKETVFPTEPYTVEDFNFADDVSASLLKLSAGSDIRLCLILLTGLDILIYKYSDYRDDDVVIGSPVVRDDAGVEFINTVLALRSRLEKDKTFKETLLQVRQNFIEDHEHRNYPIEVLIKQLDMTFSGDGFPLFDTALLLENIHKREDLDHVRPNVIFSFLKADGRVSGHVEYNSRLYERRTVKRIIGCLENLFRFTLVRVETRIADIEILSEEEKKQLLFEFNDTQSDYPRGKTIHELFAEQAAETPDQIALVDADYVTVMSYEELNRRADGVARELQRRGVVSGAVVGLLMERRLQMMVAVLGILKAGGAYLPIVPHSPGDRIAYMLADSSVELLLTTEDVFSSSEHLAKWPGKAIFLEKLHELKTEETGADSSCMSHIPYSTHLSSSPPVSPLAYVIYTSGSTGKPKGVMIEHAQLVNFVYHMYSRFDGRLGPGDKCLSLTEISFDVSVCELFLPLPFGAAVVFLAEEAKYNGDELAKVIMEQKITFAYIPPGLLPEVSRALKERSSRSKLFLNKMLVGVEPIRDTVLEEYMKLNPEMCLLNGYGPTETTICATMLTYRSFEPRGRIVPIGPPLSNMQAVIVDKGGKPVPVGIPGELCVSGRGVGRGYLNHPGLTAEKFVPSPWFPGERMYKTGDLAKWQEDGSILFIGRSDRQVKIRGFRVEPGEVENQLLKLAYINKARVIVRQDWGNDKYLCAYVVSAETVDIGQLKKELSKYLPDYMAPSYIVQLDDIPITPHGKLDIKALPVPERQSAAEYEAPRDQVEEKLVKIWAETLGIGEDKIGIHDNFFELGGHSLKATTLTAAIYKEFGVNVSIQNVFSHPTVRELAEQVRALDELEYAAVTQIKEQEHYALSYAQRRLWVLCQFEEDSTAYNMPLAVTLSGDLDIGAFQRAFRVLVERHESLRTVFITVDGRPRQKIINIKDFRFTIEQVDLRSRKEEEKQQEARSIYTAAANMVFDLEAGPLFCFKLLQMEDKKYIFVYNIHHIVNDGWSQGIISRELVTLYNCFLKGEESPLPPLELQYKDYSFWHNRLIERGGFGESRDYWLEKFKDKPNGIELPFDYPRKAVQTFNGGRVSFAIDAEKTSKLFHMGKAEDATLFMVLLTLVNVFLYRYTGQADIIVGAPIANRKRPELNQIVGFLVNTLVYRSAVNPAHSFLQQLAEVKQEALDCFLYQDYPFDLLVEQLDLERDLSQSPLFNVMLAHNNAADGKFESALEGVRISGYEYSEDFNLSKFDLIFFIDEIDDRMQVRIEYNSDLFERSTIERMAGNFLAMVDHVAEDPAVPVSVLNITTDSEYDRVTALFNDTGCEFPPYTLQEMFEQQVEKTPDKIAVIGVAGENFKLQNTNHKAPGGGGPAGITNPESQITKEKQAAKITYRELNEAANRFAHFLREEYAAAPDHVIGVSMERSIEMIIALMGIIKSGAAYLAVDPTYPRDRVLHVLSDSSAGLLVTDKIRPELFADYTGKILDITALRDQIGQKSADNPRVVNRPEHILYVNYTSGSTGTPNGAMLSHDCLTNLVKWQNGKTAIDCSLRVLQFTSINFCVSFQEIMGALTSGGELHLIGDIERQDIDYLMNFLSEHQIEVLFLPFSYLNFLFNESGRWDKVFKHNLKHIITAGEQLKITAGLKRFLDANPHLQLHNHYGSTEMHVVTSYTLDASTAALTPIPPAGKPISNIKIFILDESLKVVPIGVYGELCVAGSLELPGYINNKELTAEKLTHCPQLSDIKLYRSGDIGRWLPDGNIELRGRKDFMVKVRGFRVEPGEIESKILAIEKVRQCVVVVREDESGQKYLAAYVSLEDIEAAQVKRIISNELPQYMVPKMVVLDSLPLMPNGKVDRERLPDPKLSAADDRVIVPPGSETERKLVGIWSRLVGIEAERISIEDNFFEIGGHSLKATIMMAEIHKELDAKVELLEIFKTPTIKEIASLIDDIHWVKKGEAASDQEEGEITI